MGTKVLYPLTHDFSYLKCQDTLESRDELKFFENSWWNGQEPGCANTENSAEWNLNYKCDLVRS